MNILRRLINCVRSNWRNAILVTLFFALGLSIQPLYNQGQILIGDLQLLEVMETETDYVIREKIEREGRDFLVLGIDILDNPDGTTMVGTWVFMDARQLSLFRTPEEQSNYIMERMVEIVTLTQDYYPEAVAYAVIMGRPREIVTTTGDAVQIFGETAYIFTTTAIEYIAEVGDPTSDVIQVLYENGLFLIEDLQLGVPLPSLLQRDSKYIWPWEVE